MTNTTALSGVALALDALLIAALLKAAPDAQPLQLDAKNEGYVTPESIQMTRELVAEFEKQQAEFKKRQSR